MHWKVVKDWVDVIPIFPVMTVECRIVWLRRCQMRILSDQYNDGYDCLRRIRRIRQFRVLPVSDIWREGRP